MMIQFKQGAALLLAVAAVASAPAAQASSLLSDADKAQLAQWLGGGTLSLNSIFVKAAGDTAATFHHAVDGKGATISVMEATDAHGGKWLVGGYDPQSWSSTGGYHFTPNQKDRTGFIFNLTAGVMHLQTPDTYALGTIGAYQTYNNVNSGPTFGQGNDLWVSSDLTRGLSLIYSYRDPVMDGSYTSLLDGSNYLTGPALNATFGRMEVYTFTLAAVPEPSVALMLPLGLGLLAMARRRQRA